MAPTTINRAPFNALIDDSGQNLDGSEWDKAGITSTLLDPIDAAFAQLDAADAAAGTKGVTVVIADNRSGTINDLVLAGRTKDTYWQWDSGGADLNITGIAGGVIGDRLLIKNASGAANRKITLAYLSSASAAANRLFLTVASAPTPIGPGGWAQLICYGGGWILTAHEQGGWLSAPFSAANFVGLSGMTWTVTAGQVAKLAYRLSGKTLTVSMIFSGTTLGGTPSGYLQILPPAIGGFTAVGSDANAPAYLTDGNANTASGMLQAGTASGIVIQKFGSNFVLGATHYLYGQISYEVT